MDTSFTDWSGNEALAHYGVLGMKWGQRRFQNPDGSLTAAGKKHYDQTGEYGYQYRSHSTKKYERKVAKVASKNQANAAGMMGASMNGNRRALDKYTKKATKLAQKEAKYQQRLNRSKELDAREQDYAQRVRTGGNVAMRLLTGYIGSKPYQQHLAMNKDTTSTGSKATALIMTYFGGHTLSSIRKASYLRQDERAAKRAAKGKAADRGAAFRQRAAAAKATFEQTINKGANSVKNAYNDNYKKARRNA